MCCNFHEVGPALMLHVYIAQNKPVWRGADLHQTHLMPVGYARILSNITVVTIPMWAISHSLLFNARNIKS
jgi:hypothetical protein